MKLYKIEDVKSMMTCLFKGTAFNDFLVTEALISTYVTYRIDGSLHADYLETDTDDDVAEDPSAGHGQIAAPYVSWMMLRRDVFSLIRGHRPPSSMQLTFRLDDPSVESFLAKNSLSFTPADIAGLYLNIRLSGDDLTITTGTSLRIFSMDRSLEQAWDEAAGTLLRAAKIAFIQ